MSFKQLEKRAATEDSDAQCCLGYLLQKGESAELGQDVDRAMELYSHSADTGNNAIAMFNLALLFSKRGDMAMALEYLTKASLAGSDEALCSLGVLLLDGQPGVEIDESKALECFLKSADAGNVRACNNVGVLFASGRGGVKQVRPIECAYFCNILKVKLTLL